MSRHIVNDGKFEWVIGWDQPLQSFYIQKHDPELEEEENPVLWLGTGDTIMYEVEDLVREARRLGLHIDHVLQTRLYSDRDFGL